MIWVVGKNGMLGSEVQKALDKSHLPWVGTDRDVDITDEKSLREFSFGRNIEWIVNCAAYTAVDKAEDEPQIAHAINARGPENLARIAVETGARLVHISTDYVFDGTGRRPYREDDSIAPIGVYGRTKAEGEEMVRAYCSQAVILRSAWLFGRNGKNFVDTMLQMMRKQQRIRVVDDQHGSPTYAVDLAAAILSIIGSDKKEFGIFNYTNDGETTWYDFAVAIRDEAHAADILHDDCVIEAITTSQYPTIAQRPAYSVLSKDKIKRVFGLVVPDWRDGLHRYFLQSFPHQEAI